MKTKTTLIILFFLFKAAISVKGQGSGTIDYTLKIKSDIYPTDIINYKLWFHDNKSIQLLIPNKIIDTGEVVLSENAILIKKQNPIVGKPYFLYKNFNTHELFMAGGILLKSYLIEDTIANFNWQISKEKQRKLNYNCIKATTYFRGRTYTAWFAEDIPIQEGPWKFCGLPGLIIEISDSDSKFVFELAGIDLKTYPVANNIEIPKEYNKSEAIGVRKFVELYNKKTEQLKALSKVVKVEPSGGTSTTTISIPEIMEKF